MSVWHSNMKKKKKSSGRKHSYRKKRKFETGSFPTETTLGEIKKKVIFGRGEQKKIRLLTADQINVSNPSTGTTEKVKILRIAKNPAILDYDRRGVITKGTFIETPLGLTKVTSRPGQNGIINAVIIQEKIS